MQRIIILNGAVSSRKTTIGNLLVDELTKHGEDAIFFDLDDLVEKRSPNFKCDTPEARLKDWLNARKELAEITNKQLREGKTVVVVGPFFTKEEIDGYIKYLTREHNDMQRNGLTLVKPSELVRRKQEETTNRVKRSPLLRRPRNY